MQNHENSVEITVEEKFSAQKIEFFITILDLLPFYNWNEKLMLAAEEKCNFQPYYHYLLFPGSIKQVILEMSAWQDQVMIEELKSLYIDGKTKEKISLAIYKRITLNSKLAHIKYISYFASTANLALATNLAWQTCSEIWHQAGDKSVDFNYYTKRGLLLSVYVSAISFYASDESPQDADTKQYIDNALNFVTEIAKFKNNIKLPKIVNIPFLRLL